MANVLRHLVRNQSKSAARIFGHFNQTNPPPVPPAALVTQIPRAAKKIYQFPLDPSVLKNDAECDSHLFPRFSLDFFLHPVSPTGPIQPESEDTVIEDSRTIRADSVKKKRKKKMNKHKLKKLRKRLRRKT